MEDVGGLDCIKDFITSRKVAYTPGAEDFGVKRPKGIFMSGIPGTGKSLAARACGSVLNWPVVRLTLSDLYAGIVGSTEKNTKETLAILERLAPAVVFLDEIDKSINVNSGNGDSGTSQRLLGAILTFMQDSQAPLFWVMAANRVDNLPSELLRKGRLDECFGLDFPTSQERMEVLKIHLRKRGQDIKGIDEEVLETVVADTSGYVPAEIESIVNEAVLTRYRLHLENNESPTLTYADFKAATINMKCIAEVNKEQVQSIQQWVRTSARSASSSTEQLIKPKKAARKATRTDLFEEL
jgi:SpoVK/Ycf46/Vps4 family AAA+-type ATPase